MQSRGLLGDPRVYVPTSKGCSVWTCGFLLFVVGFGFSLYVTKIVLDLNLEKQNLQEQVRTVKCIVVL